MPTRDEIAAKIDADLQARGLRPDDPAAAFVRQTLQDMNEGMADLDDELADLSRRLKWLLNAATWTNVRVPGVFEPFVEAQLLDCQTTLAAIRERWARHIISKPSAPPQNPLG